MYLHQRNLLSMIFAYPDQYSVPLPVSVSWIHNNLLNISFFVTIAFNIRKALITIKVSLDISGLVLFMCFFIKETMRLQFFGKFHNLF